MEELTSLVARAQEGDLDAFGALVASFKDAALRTARSVLNDRDLAEDAVQESFIQAYRGLPSLREPAAFPGWLRRIVVNHSHRLLRGKRVPLVPLEDASEVASDGADPAEAVQRQELKERVMDAVRKLPENERTVTTLFYFDGYSQNEIAEYLGIPVTTVNTRLYTSRKRLRDRMSDLVEQPLIERMSRSKMGRRLLPSNRSERETIMALRYESTNRRLLKGDTEVTLRTMNREDIPLVRRFDMELTGVMDESNQMLPPGRENHPGGPWSNDEWLAGHFDRYEKDGGLILLATDDSGRVVGFAELWPSHEPEPFGDSLNVECIDYFREYYYMGLETVLLEEAEKVARSAGLPSLDIGTNTVSGDYPTLRSFGLKVFYEYDDVTVRCPEPAETRLPHRMIQLEDLDLSGLLKVNHWAPTGFYAFMVPEERMWLAEIDLDGLRAVLELHGPSKGDTELPVPEYAPEGADLFAPPEAMRSKELMSMLLRECAMLAGEAGAKEIKLPCPSDLALDPGKVGVVKREFAYAWLRKRVA